MITVADCIAQARGDTSGHHQRRLRCTSVASRSCNRKLIERERILADGNR